MRYCWTHRPANAVKRHMAFPAKAEFLLKFAESFISQIFEARNGVRGCSEAVKEGCAAFNEHAFTTCWLRVPRGVSNDDHAVVFQAAHRLPERCRVILRIVEGSIEDNGVELSRGER